MVLLPSMFSSFLHPSTSSTKMAQSGPSKPSNRFSVRVFKTQSNIPPSYPVNGKNDLGGYRQPPPSREQQREPQNMGWYPPPSNVYSSYDSRPRATANYAIYPSATDGTFIYEQSACSKSDIFSEMDGASMGTFSPAMSTDSTLTLPSTNAGDRPAEYSKRPETPAPRPNYVARTDSVSQGPAMSRVTSNHRPAEAAIDEQRGRTPMMQARSAPPNHLNPSTGRNDTGPQTLAPSGYPMEIPEYAASSMSEMEVQERDRIAKINAGYNSTSTGSLYSGNSDSSSENRMPAISRNASVLNRDSVAFNTSQQPLHPGLRFPPRVPEEPILPHPSTQMNGGGSMAAFPQAFPIVERIPSQMPLPEHQVLPPGFQVAYHHMIPAQDPRGPPGPSRSSSYQTSPKRSPTQPPIPTPTTHYSGQSAYGTSLPDTASFNDHRLDRVPSTFVETPRSRRTSFVGTRPDANLQRHPSDVSRSQADYRYDDNGRRAAEASQSPVRETPYSGRPEPSRNQSSSPRDLPRSAVASDLRRDTRTPSPKEYDDGRPTYVSRRDSYLDGSRSGKDQRWKSQSNDVRDVYGNAPLSSSPVQMRESPTEIEPTFSRRSGFNSEYDQAMERPRTRSTSFSAAVRPTFPQSTQQAQAYEMQRSDSRYASDEERYTRTGDRSGGKGPSDSARSANQHDFERRSDTRTSSSQATHYSQTVPLPPTTAPYDPSSQRQTTSGSGSGPIPSAPRTVDRMNSVMQPQASQTRGHAQENVSSRSRSAYPEPAYSQPQPPPQPLTEPVRRSSDPEKYYSSMDSYQTKDTYSVKDGRGSRPSEPQNVPIKASGQQGTRASTVLGAGTASSEPHRRNSDGDQNPPVRPPLSGRMSAPLLRSVRWNDNLICPSPIPTSARRKGWYNRRGDQLWTNDGAYKAAPAGQEYPPDLDDYPEYEEGWQNEEGTRIDLNHRLVPKPPLRSALKPARN
ncbi:hypothetical protein D9619_010981 [Psilocybe cf. subviscida]|uniref:Uncharacterized protein n=1 Tax=Psilocybe cf. subviscida TaxID=2480587 RepID=A0A8H5B8M6_9AGAR|nr:hypothetical protein D9619_010981 [Psilocybe cf. subviscida]